MSADGTGGGGEASIRATFRGRLGPFALDAAFTVPARGVTGLFGPSGCGKTSVLRALAGLLRLDDGYCAVAGEVWQDGRRFRPVHERAIGYVFQEASLFPHLSVRRNLLYGAPGGLPPAGGDGGVGFDTVVELLGLARLLERAPRHLSGGERQRVAMGRALLSQPRLLLMDEPLSALDRATKDEILPFLEGLQGALGLPMIYVSHDMAEMERLADHLVLMEGGRVRAAGPLNALQADPDLPLAGARDAGVSLDAAVADWDAAYGLLTLDVEGARFLTPAPRATPGERRRLRIAAGDVSLTREAAGASTILNILPVRILTANPIGDSEVLAVLALGRQGGLGRQGELGRQGALGHEGGQARLLARVTRLSWERLGLAAGMDVHAQIKSVALALPRR